MLAQYMVSHKATEKLSDAMDQNGYEISYLYNELFLGCW